MGSRRKEGWGEDDVGEDEWGPRGRKVVGTVVTKNVQQPREELSALAGVEEVEGPTRFVDHRTTPTPTPT